MNNWTLTENLVWTCFTSDSPALVLVVDAQGMQYLPFPLLSRTTATRKTNACLVGALWGWKSMCCDKSGAGKL